MKKSLPKIAVSIGDINGIGLEILIKAHKKISKICEPFYFVHENLLKNGLNLLGKKLKNANLIAFDKAENSNFKLIKKSKSLNIYRFTAPLKFKPNLDFEIKPGVIDERAGAYGFLSFEAANFFTAFGLANALVTLPIHKKAWEMAGLKYKGHTDFLREFYQKDAIMMLGCKELFVGLFSEHIALNEVSERIKFEPLASFLIDFYTQTSFEKIGVLGFNPHASDFGVIGGKEEEVMIRAIKLSNAFLSFMSSSKEKQSSFLASENALNLGQNELLKRLVENEDLNLSFQKAFSDFKPYIEYPLVADTAFTPSSLKNCKHLVAMYHDLGLAPLKALYFEKSVNISLNLPIIRTSVDHGTAFDKAYKNTKINTKSYKEAVLMAVRFLKNR